MITNMRVEEVERAKKVEGVPTEVTRGCQRGLDWGY